MIKEVKKNEVLLPETIEARLKNRVLDGILLNINIIKNFRFSEEI